jgi:predicted acylesterase/phospholipase RssA
MDAVERAEALLDPKLEWGPDAPSYTELCELATELRASEHYSVLTRLLIKAGRQALYKAWAAGDWGDLAELMCDHQQFGYARRLFGRLRADGDTDELRRRYAFCTYKDMELPLARRLDKALEILSEKEEPELGDSAETAGLAGAILKRRWMVDLRRADLDAAYRCYAHGFTLPKDEQAEYAGINAAFVADRISALEAKVPGAEVEAARWTARADKIRGEIVTCGGGTDGWRDATLAEAHFGLGEIGAACEVLTRHEERKPKPWQLESTAMQLAELGELREVDPADTKRVLEALLGDAGGALTRPAGGKVGLALSGGGFRASLFHIGVLARLAECGMLRRVEVLSCVSGGSILGAFYYLKLRELLQRKRDAEITDLDYVKLVEAVVAEFVAAVRKDLRGHLFTNVLADLRMIGRSRYSRSERVADLLDGTLYSRVEKDKKRDAESPEPWLMTDLLITPADSKAEFSLRYSNWRREAKVPMLVLNATTLNTGHGWQFTASWMGEPPQVLEEPVDASRRLRRIYYGDAPPAHQKPRLATAVGASAAVPGLFPPVRLEALYKGDGSEEDWVDVELADGGVFDNQGIASLIEQDCGVLLVSDASGQAREDDAPKRGILGVAKRSNSVLMSRVRGAQLEDLAARTRSGALRGTMIVHLKKGLPDPPRDWRECQEPYCAKDDVLAPPEEAEPLYGIDPEAQRALAELRTDLDLFSADEANALMAAGYRMAKHELTVGLGDPGSADKALEDAASWPFAPMLASLEDPGKLTAELRIGNARFFRRARRLKQAIFGTKPGALSALWRGAKKGADVGVVHPVRWVVGVPLSIVGGTGASLYEWASRIGDRD